MTDEAGNITNVMDTQEWQDRHPALSDPMHAHAAQIPDELRMVRECMVEANTLPPEAFLAVGETVALQMTDVQMTPALEKMMAEAPEEPEADVPHKHVHGPDCNHDSVQVEEPMDEATKAQKDAAASFVETVLAQMNSVLNTVSVDEISRQLTTKNAKGTRKYRIGKILMVPRLLNTQLYHLFKLQPPYWQELQWAPLRYTFEVIGYFMHEEAKRRLIAAKAQFPNLRLFLDDEATKQGLSLSVESKRLMEEVERVEHLFRKPRKIILQDVHGDSIRFQPWRLNMMQTAPHWKKLMGNYGLKEVQPTEVSESNVARMPNTQPEIQGAI